MYSLSDTHTTPRTHVRQWTNLHADTRTCIITRIHAHEHTHQHTLTNPHTDAPTHMHMYAWTAIYRHCVCGCSRVCVRLCACVREFMCVCLHACVFACVCVCACECMLVCMWVCDVYVYIHNIHIKNKWARGWSGVRACRSGLLHTVIEYVCIHI